MTKEQYEKAILLIARLQAKHPKVGTFTHSRLEKLKREVNEYEINNAPLFI